MTTIPGRSGTNYPYTRHDAQNTGTLPSGAGNYAFMRTNPQGSWEVIYAGESENIQNRVSQHLQGNTDQSSCINGENPSEVWVHASGKNKADRLAEEADIIAGQRPHCND